jgi:phage terminase small subunit
MELPPLFLDRDDHERDYFLALAAAHARELALHEHPGKLWEKDEEGKDWANVTEHCLLEAARGEALAELLGLSPEMRANLAAAGAVHDFNKKEEMRFTREDIAAGGTGRGKVIEMEAASEAILKKAGIPPLVVSLAEHVSGDPKHTFFMRELLDKQELSEEDIAHLAMHYIDNYTKGSAWAEPAAEEGGMEINDIDRRNRMNAKNPAYAAMDKESKILNDAHPFFKGMTRFEGAAAINHAIEKRFAELITARGGPPIRPIDLPEAVDLRIKEKIKTARPT